MGWVGPLSPVQPTHWIAPHAAKGYQQRTPVCLMLGTLSRDG
jgi:hypothetical protein